MKRWIDLTIAFTAGIVATLVFAHVIGPYEVRVGGETTLIVRYNKLTGRTQVYSNAWKDLK